MRDDLPTGTVTFLFTDVEGSTRLLHELGAEGYAEALAEHRRLIREVCARHEGVEVDTQGDAFFFAFPTAPGALAAGAALTESLAPGQIHVRLGLHTGTPLVTDEGYVGDDVHRAARIAAVGHGGQVLVAASTAALVGLDGLVDLGEHRLKGLAAPERVYQLGEQAFPPLKSLYRSNLPLAANPLVGRKKELADVSQALLGGSRAVTITGPGGVGKTRFALAVASEAERAFPDGVWFVPLASLRDPALVLPTVAGSIGARGDVARHIGDAQCLLFLDNFEQVVDAAPSLATLAGECPRLRLLVTSREALRIAVEREYPLSPLPESPSVELFRQRADAVAPELEIDYATAGAICDRLDRLPLAIELAAARCKALSPEQILDRVSKSLDLLRGGRDADPRQQTLRATIEWSYDLLSDEEQRLFHALSVFASGCTLEAAEEVAGADLDTLQSLVEKSLLRFSHRRYWMLETIRDYAAERLDETSEGEQTRMRLVDFYVQLAEDREPRLGELNVIAALQEDEGNLRAALSLAQSRAPEAMLRISGALWRYWYLRVQLDEGRQWLEQALRSSDERVSSARARALRGVAALESRAGNEGAAVAPLERALAMYRLLSDDDGVSRCLNNLGAIAAARLDFDEATRLYEAALAAGRRLAERGTGPGLATPLTNLAEVTLERGDFAAARRLGEEALTCARQEHDDAVAVQAEVVLAWLAVREERFDEAARLLRGALQIARDLGLRYVGGTLLLVALVAVARGREMEAARLWGAIAALRGRVGIRSWTDEERRTKYFAPYVELERQLTEAGYSSHFAEGAAMSFEEALELAQHVVD